MKPHKSKCALLLSTFALTALFDVLLQLAKHGYMPPIQWLVGKSDWFVALTRKGGYFDRHTPLAAALLAGFAGFAAQAIILALLAWPDSFKSLPLFMTVTFFVSALVGLLMNDAWSTSLGLFPVLSKTYYADLGKLRSMVTDGLSGLVVNATLFAAFHLLS